MTNTSQELEKRDSPNVSTDRDILSNLVHTPENFHAGKVSLYTDAWKCITSDRWLLSQLQGYSIEFVQIPYQHKHPPNIRFSQEEQTFIHEQMNKLIERKVVEPVGPSDRTSSEFISNIFLRPKKDGSYRLILNLKILNNDVEHIHFKMETLKSAITLMTSDCWFASIDLKDAYYSIPIHNADKKYLRFIWNETCYQFCCLPFGLSSAPRVFTKIMKPK